MLTPYQVYNVGRDAFLAKIGRENNPFKHPMARMEWDRGYTQEHNDAQDVVTAQRKAA